MFRLEEIEIEGYRSIRRATVPLRPLNVLIGANGAGKSNLLGVLSLLRDLAGGHLGIHVARRGGANSLLHFGRKKTPLMRFVLRFAAEQDTDPTRYEVSLEPISGDEFAIAEEVVEVQRWQVSNPFESPGPAGSRESKLSDLPPGIVDLYLPSVFHFNDTGPSSSIKSKQPVDDNRTLRPDGKNLAALLYRLQRSERRSYREITEAVRVVAPFFGDFLLQPDALNPKVIQLEWKHRSEPNSYFNADALSDGTLRFICLATLLLQPDKPPLILLDEPELGLHPAAIVYVAELLRMVSKTTQVIITTQSVTLLEQFEAEDVVVVERKNEESCFRRLSEAELAGWLDDYTLGQLWLKNVLGGRP